jgi:cytochrome c oxidase subunit 2
MALFVVADAPQAWERWAERQRAPAELPRNAEEERGRTAFLASTCALCHAIRGTSAGGQHAPDLTHVASRMTLAAGTVPNDAGSRAAWIADPQSIKPGTKMPATTLAPQDLTAINAFLGSLQ